MPIVPEEWSVVIIGALESGHPDSIWDRQAPFDLPVGTQVEVHVPIDVLAPFKVRHEGIDVMAGHDRLIINPEKCDDPNLSKAMRIAQKALKELPETPVSAAGFNFKFKSKKSVPVLAAVVSHDVDWEFADHNLPVLSRAITRFAKWREGEIRLTVSQESDQSYEILLKFPQGFGLHGNAQGMAVSSHWRCAR